MFPVPIIVSRVFRSTTADTLDMTRACSHCGHTSPARVSVYSVGEAEALLPLDRSNMAYERAIEGLGQAAEHMLALAACPHCKTREPTAQRKVHRAAISATVLTSRATVPIVLAAFTFMLAALVIVNDHLDGDGAMTILVGLGFVAISWMLARAGIRKRVAKALDMADATVVWLGHEQPQLVPTPTFSAVNADNGWPFA